MSILFLLIPLGLLLVCIAVWAFFWAVSSGQFDDLSSPAYSVLMDDDEKPETSGAGSSPDRAGAGRKDRDAGNDGDARA